MPNFTQTNASLLISDAVEPTKAIARTTHLGIGAHQDDLEFMALHGILECFQKHDRWFGGITCTDGAGSPRNGPYAEYTDEQMKSVRIEEQNAAARIGQYSFMAQLGHPSAHSKDPGLRTGLVEDLTGLIQTARPDYIYTHNPFDKHATHVGVFHAVIEAIRRLPANQRPVGVFGCEVWRGLDWLPDELKVVHDVSAHPNLAAALNGVFDSQITGGKRYDRGVEGRRMANATFLESHAVDTASHVSFAVDLTPLTADNGPSVDAFVKDILSAFCRSIRY